MSEPKQAVAHALVATVKLTQGFALLVVTDDRTYLTRNQKYVCDIDDIAKFFGAADMTAVLEANVACAAAFSKMYSAS